IRAPDQQQEASAEPLEEFFQRMRQKRAALEGETTLRQVAADGVLPVEEETFRIDGEPVPLAEHVEGRSQSEPLVGRGDLRLTAGDLGQEGGPAAPGADAETDPPVELIGRLLKHLLIPEQQTSHASACLQP